MNTQMEIKRRDWGKWLVKENQQDDIEGKASGGWKGRNSFGGADEKAGTNWDHR